MGVNKILRDLQKNLKKGDKKKAHVHCERIDDLLDKLKKKESKLKKKLATEKNKHKRKQLTLELKIVSLEHKKGTRRRKELADKCK